MQIASELGLSSRAVRVKITALDRLTLPAILHWDFDHFVVLAAVTKAGVTIHDPRSGRSNVSFEQLSGHFTGVAVELEPEADQVEPIAPVQLTLGQLTSGMSGLWSSGAQIFGLLATSQLIIVGFPFIFQLVIDRVIPASSASLLLAICSCLLVLTMLAATCDAIRSWTILTIANQIVRSLYSKLLRRLLRLPVEWFDKQHTGDLLTRVHSVEQIQRGLTTEAASGLLNVVTSLLLLGVLYAYDVLLASLVLASIVLQFLISQAFYGELKGRREAQLAATGAEQNHVLESLRTIKAIRIFGHEAAREGQWSNLFVAVLNRTASAEQLRIALAFSETVIFGVQSAVVIYLAGMRLLVSGDLTVGMLVSFLFYRQYLVECAKTAIQNVTSLRLLRLHLDRLSHVLLEDEDPSLSTGVADELGPLADVEFRDVRFRYGGADTDTLFDINLKIKAGEFVAFVGPTGGGKSTLAKLLLGLYQPTRGEILIGGQPMNRIGAREWRRNVGAVLQEDTLLAGSIADNISFFDADLDLERVRVVAKPSWAFRPPLCRSRSTHGRE